ncbi:hypothetical protein EG68_08775 [Paragonimus skrjabini miyazakii]|uniref:Cilia- and flagella-associated protein 69 ARM repeats domain-containing protein n=1 Tax=Paragonimus skrjabini miyazakii TaxID=59628 RepID=A0A8S9YNL8_9TREM|nr:hypothetical protein EG68_08775 [Paragonimus skrjabini miyazakii]
MLSGKYIPLNWTSEIQLPLGGVGQYASDSVTLPEFRLYGSTSTLNFDTELLFEKAIKLISDPHTIFMFERHRILLSKLVVLNCYGYKLRDLVSLYQVLNLCAERLSTLTEVYKSSLLSLIGLCKLPFLKELSSDEHRYLEFCTDCICQLGYLLRFDNEEIQLCICDTIIELYNPIQKLPVLPEDSNLRYTSLEFVRKVIESSDIAESVFMLYSTMNDFRKLRFSLMDLLQKLTRNSIVCSKRLISISAPRLICLNMSKPSVYNPLLSRSVETLWNLADHPHASETVVEWTKQVGHEDCLLQLRDAFFLQLAQSHSKFCRNLRNDIMTVISLIIKNTAQFSDLIHIPLTELGIVKQIIQLFTLEKVKQVNPLFKNLRLLPNPENFDLKKMIISALVWLVHNPMAVKVMKETRLVQTLLEWVCPFILLQEQTPPQSGLEAPCETAADDEILVNTSEITATKGSVATYMETDINRMKLSQAELTEESGIDQALEEEHVEEEEEEDNEKVLPDELVLADGSQPHRLAAHTRLEAMKQWPLAFLEELQLHVLDALCTLGPALLDDILLYNGPESLMQLLLWCQNSDPFVGYGNSFQSTGGHKTTRAQMRFCLRLLRNLVESSDERIIESLVSHGIIQLVASLLPMASVCGQIERPHVELKSFGPQTVRKRGRKYDNDASLKTTLKEKKFEEDAVGLEMQIDMLFILAKICEKDVQKKEILGVEDRLAQLENESIPSLQIRHSGDPLSARASRGIDVQMLVQRTPLLTLTTALIDAIWCGVVGSVNCEDYFLMQGGATLLLDLLEVSGSCCDAIINRNRIENTFGDS